MRCIVWVAMMAGTFLLACGSNPGVAGFGSTEDDGGGNNSSGGSGSSGGGNPPTTNSSSSSGGLSDSGEGSPADDGGAGQLILDGAIPPSDYGQSVTLSATPFVVAAGAEVYKCQRFANPFGAAADLLWMHGTM